MTEQPRYSFHPLERRGVLLGLDGGQVATVLIGALTALIAHAAVKGPVGLAGAAAIAGGALGLALWTRDGAAMTERARLGVAWMMRRSSGPILDGSPLDGFGLVRRGRVLHTSLDPGSTPVSAGPPRSLHPSGIELFEEPAVPGEGPLGVVRNRADGSLVAVLPVAGTSFALLDAAHQARVLEAWRQVLGVVARPGGALARVQWLRAGRIPEPARPAVVHHQTWLALAVPGRGSRGSRTALPASGLGELRREVRLIRGHLRAAGLEPDDAMTLDSLSALISSLHGPGTTTRRLAAPWPMASDESWSCLRTDAAWHATYWIAEWPRIEVGPDFLMPLLVGPGHRRLSVVMGPVPAERALRQVRAARTADLADAELRSRAGFLESARRDRESQGVLRREAELADGHHEFRFSGYLTVSAGGHDGLAAACAEAEHAAQSAHLEIRRLYGRQAEAFTWTLPLVRGLR
jgi:hypothetical protein